MKETLCSIWSWIDDRNSLVNQNLDGLQLPLTFVCIHLLSKWSERVGKCQGRIAVWGKCQREMSRGIIRIGLAYLYVRAPASAFSFGQIASSYLLLFNNIRSTGVASSFVTSWFHGDAFQSHFVSQSVFPRLIECLSLCLCVISLALFLSGPVRLNCMSQSLSPSACLTIHTAFDICDQNFCPLITAKLLKNVKSHLCSMTIKDRRYVYTAYQPNYLRLDFL